MAQLWVCGDFQMGEKGEVTLGFKVFVITIEIVIMLAIMVGAWLIDKLLLAPSFVLAFRLARVKIETKYDIFHCATVLCCMVVSTLICLFGLYISLPKEISLISNIIVGVGFAVITWELQEIINIKLEFTKEARLIAKCKELGYNELKTEMAVKFFIKNEKPKDVWLWLCETQENPMEWDSVKNLKHKMKKDLF